MWINPIALQLGPIAIHWYGIMYALTFIIGYFLFQKSWIGAHLKLSSNQKDNLLIAIIAGVLIGGRFGYILFYNLPYYLQNPLKTLSVWEGGMSFHGGLLGVLLAIYLFAKKNKVPLLLLTDTTAIITPIGILLGRLGNFINGELYGRITNSFCFNFPTDPLNCRYPSQLFEAAFEGLILFLILYFYAKKLFKKTPTQNGVITSLFLIFYGIFRFIIEFFREPDQQIGYILNIFTQGQILCIPAIVAGTILYFASKKSSSS